MTGGNPFYDAFFDDLISQFPAGPLADRTTALAGGLTSQGHDLANLLWGDPGGSPRTRRIPQPFFYKPEAGEGLGAAAEVQAPPGGIDAENAGRRRQPPTDRRQL